MKYSLHDLIPGPSKVLFYSEGNPAAILLSREASRRATKTMRFDHAEAALAWCRGHDSVLVYCPARPDRN